MIRKPVVERLDRAKFEIYGYSTTESTDDFSRSYRAVFDHFSDLPVGDARGSEQRIAGDGIHVLLEVSGHTIGSCLPTLAFRPAPVQIHGLGYSITTGANFVDYLLTERRFMPPELAAHNREASVNMQHSFMIAPRAARRAALLCEAVGLPPNAVVFANFSHPCKIEPDAFGAWMRILPAVPNAVLWMGAFFEGTVKNLSHEAAKHGVDPARLIFSPLAPRE